MKEFKEFEPKILSKEELKRFSSGINGEEILEFKKHSLNNFVEPLTVMEAVEPGSPRVRVWDEEG